MSNAGESVLDIPPPQQNRIPVLDGWRTMSVGLVIVCHLFVYSGIRIDPATGFLAERALVPMLTGMGAQGVDIFFVISGYVICRSFVLELAETQRISLLAFYVRRTFRIIPPLLLYVTVIIAIASLGLIETDPVKALRMLSFTCNFHEADCGGYIGAHTWSLSVEEQFYLLVPLLFLIFGRFRRTFINCLVICLLIGPLLLHLSGRDFAATILFNFMYIGVGAAWASNQEKFQRLATGIPAWAVYRLLALLPVLARLGQTRFWAFVAIIQAIAIITLLVMTTSRRSRFTDFLHLPIIQKIGRASYGVYLWQQLATMDFQHDSYLFYVASMSLMLIWSILLFDFVEKPTIRQGNRLSGRIRAGAGT